MWMEIQRLNQEMFDNDLLNSWESCFHPKLVVPGFHSMVSALSVRLFSCFHVSCSSFVFACAHQSNYWFLLWCPGVNKRNKERLGSNSVVTSAECARCTQLVWRHLHLRIYMGGRATSYSIDSAVLTLKPRRKEYRHIIQAIDSLSCTSQVTRWALEQTVDHLCVHCSIIESFLKTVFHSRR